MGYARASKSEQCAGFTSVSYERKTAKPFFDSRLIRAISSSAEKSLASPIKEKRYRRFSTLELKRVNPSSGRSRHIRVPLTTAFLLRKNARLFYNISTRHPCRTLNKTKFPAQDLRASPITRSDAHVTPCVLIRNCSRLSYFLLHPKG